MILLLLPEWLTLFNAILLGVVGLVAVAVTILLFLSRKQSETLALEKGRADSNAGLVTTRDNRIKDLEHELEEKTKRLAQVEEELEQVTAEYRAIVGIDIQKLLEYWQTRDFELAQMVNLRGQIRVLKMAKGLGEDDDVIHKTEG